ncbi:hypothetical protein BKA80DRAFT_280859 [Phyllosticta citrichinensis]
MECPGSLVPSFPTKTSKSILMDSHGIAAATKREIRVSVPAPIADTRANATCDLKGRNSYSSFSLSRHLGLHLILRTRNLQVEIVRLIVASRQSLPIVISSPLRALPKRRMEAVKRFWTSSRAKSGESFLNSVMWQGVKLSIAADRHGFRLIDPFQNGVQRQSRFYQHTERRETMLTFTLN